MKVCTDACIFGAWYASKLNFRNAGVSSHFSGVKNILDIGGGTGLLMMMLAQNTNADIHGIEIEPGCFKQLKKNISQNDWSSRISGFEGDARNYLFPIQYDFIISNPPFYENDLSPEKENKQLAMHSKALNLEELVTVITKNLKDPGIAGIMLPFHRSSAFESLAAKKGLIKTEELKVRQTPKHNWFRSISSYTYSQPTNVPATKSTINVIESEIKKTESKLKAIESKNKATESKNKVTESTIKITELTIKDASGNYSDEFRHLLGPYYLHLPDQELSS
jgi:tRNA1Val (adenine37-N6)-methyltransferase